MTVWELNWPENDPRELTTRATGRQQVTDWYSKFWLTSWGANHTDYMLGILSRPIPGPSSPGDTDGVNVNTNAFANDAVDVWILLLLLLLKLNTRSTRFHLLSPLVCLGAAVPPLSINHHKSCDTLQLFTHCTWGAEQFAKNSHSMFHRIIDFRRSHSWIKFTKSLDKHWITTEDDGHWPDWNFDL